MRYFRKSSDGFTFIELVVSMAVIAILASAALPIVRVSIKRQREAQLRYNLREMREAIDSFKDWADTGQIAMSELSAGAEGYPPSLEVLVEGVALANDQTGRKKKFLRRIPLDPMTGRADWGMRAYVDPPDAKVWGGGSVFDVYSKSEGIALDGTKYRDW